jgi:hypothetical protein
MRQSCSPSPHGFPAAQDALARENNKLYAMESFPARHIWRWAVHLSLAMIRKIADKLVYWGLLLLTPVIGLKLSEFRNLQIYKLFYVIGIAWSMFGVVTLSYLAATSDEFKKKALKISSYIFRWVFMILPFGMLVGAMLGLFLGHPSVGSTIKVGGYLGFAGLASLFFFEDFVEEPKFRFAATLEKRIGFMGGYFVMAGLLFQFFAAVFDLVGFNG